MSQGVVDITADADEKCVKCKLLFTNRKSAVGCDFCKGWYHLSCTDASKALFAELVKSKDDAVTWKCLSCRTVS